jgi:hypothetical protein
LKNVSLWLGVNFDNTLRWALRDEHCLSLLLDENLGFQRKEFRDCFDTQFLFDRCVCVCVTVDGIYEHENKKGF